MQDDYEKCLRDDVRALVPQQTCWRVNDDGTVNASDFCCEYEALTDTVDVYRCNNCGEDFDTWPEALAHLPKQETTA